MNKEKVIEYAKKYLEVPRESNLRNWQLGELIRDLRKREFSWEEIVLFFAEIGFKKNGKALYATQIRYFANRQKVIRKNKELVEYYLNEASKVTNLVEQYQLLYDAKKSLRMSYKSVIEMFEPFDFRTKSNKKLNVYLLAYLFTSMKRRELIFDKQDENKIK